MKNRWIVLIAGVIIQTIFGGIYAWSSFGNQLIDKYDLNKGQSSLIFGVTIAVFTLAMTFGGQIISKLTARYTTLIGGILFGSGYIIASFSNGSFPILLTGIGVVTGIGIGLGYVCPLSVCMKWFPSKKGLVTGVAVGGFGGGAILLTSIAGHFFKATDASAGTDVLIFFRWLGIIGGLCLILCSLFLQEPTNEKQEQKVPTKKQPSLKSKPFWLLTFGIFCGTFSGLLVIGNLAQLVGELDFSPAQAGVSISIFSMGNAFGRIVWGHFFDRINYRSIPLSLLSLALCLPLLLIGSSLIGCPLA